ncbi:MAG: alpha/beta hydrolase [Cytophagaceae bacterium]|nr:MAG: alpha/beta hydrolase [Cytophagaceae bacterium]
MTALQRHNATRIGTTTGRSLVFAHGYGCDQSVWLPVASALASNHDIVLYDFAGCGGADPALFDPERHGTLEGYADDLIEVCEASQLDHPVFIGHSVGAMVGVRAARRRPNLFDSLVLVAPSPSYINDGDYIGGFEREDIDDLLDTLEANYFNWARMMAPVVMGNPDRPELAGALGDSFCRMDNKVARHFARVLFLADSRFALKDVTIPSLLLQCSDDALASPKVGRYLAEQLVASSMVQLTATGHCPHMSAPLEVIEILSNFLKQRG